MDYTAIIRKGRIKYVSFCPEVGVASQGNTIEESMKNLKEAVELYIEEMGVPEQYLKGKIIIDFEVKKHGKTPSPLGI